MAAGRLGHAPGWSAALGTAVGLHALWNWRPLDVPWALVWPIVIGAASVLVLWGVIQRAAHEEGQAIFALAPEAVPTRSGLQCISCGRTAPVGAHYCPRCSQALLRRAS